MTDERDSVELPEAFTPKQRRDDPVLGSIAMDNPIFEAFRSYRELYPRDRRRIVLWKRLRLPVALVWTLVFVAALRWLPLPQPMTMSFVMGIGLPPVILLMHANLLTMARISFTVFQALLNGLDDRRRSRAQDLWLAGATGRMALESAYLEMAQRAGTPAAVIALVTTVPMAVAGVKLKAEPNVIAAAIGGLALFAWLTRGFIVQIQARFRVRMLKMTVEFWKVPAGGTRELRYTGKLMISTLPLSFGLILLTLPPILIVVWGIIARRATPPSPLQPLWPIFVAAWFVVLGVIAALLAGRIARRNLRTWEAMREEADAAFEIFFRRALMEDPDG